MSQQHRFETPPARLSRSDCRCRCIAAGQIGEQREAGRARTGHACEGDAGLLLQQRQHVGDGRRNAQRWWLKVVAPNARDMQNIARRERTTIDLIPCREDLRGRHRDERIDQQHGRARRAGNGGKRLAAPTADRSAAVKAGGNVRTQRVGTIEQAGVVKRDAVLAREQAQRRCRIGGATAQS